MATNAEDALRTVLSMLDDAKFDWNRSNSDGCVSKCTNKHFCHIYCLKYR